VISATLGAGGNGIFLQEASDIIIKGNHIGTDATGIYALGNSADGILVQDSQRVIIGGSAPGEGNQICCNMANGILLQGSDHNLIKGNLIGTDPAFQRPLGNAQSGIKLNTTDGNTIGHTGVNAGNVIQFNGGPGVNISSGESNTISGNQIFANVGPGIDLNADGDTINDPLDADAGANLSQNYPVVTEATSTQDSTQISCSLNSTPNTLYHLEFFASPQQNPTGTAAGMYYLGSLSASTLTDGSATIQANLPVVLTPDYLLTATATDPAGNTSEFSSALQPSLSATPLALTASKDSSSVIVKWRGPVNSFQLEYADSLQQPIQWITISNGITLHGPWKIFTFRLDSTESVKARFFRLRFP
jgi:hypothetical protein